MTRKLVLVLGLIVLLSTLSVRTAFGEASLEPTTVSYTASRSVSYDDPANMIDFDVTVKLECEITYSCSVDGVLPATSTCHLNLTPHYGTLALDYRIDRPVELDLDGFRSIPLPLGGQEVLGDSPPIDIPIDIGIITIAIHGHLLGYLSSDIGSVNPSSFKWSTWESQDTVISTDAQLVRLTIATTYVVYFTVTVSVDTFESVSVNSTMRETQGKPSPVFVIPEFPSSLILPLFMLTTLLAVIMYGRKHSRNVRFQTQQRELQKSGNWDCGFSSSNFG